MTRVGLEPTTRRLRVGRPLGVNWAIASRYETPWILAFLFSFQIFSERVRNALHLLAHRLGAVFHIPGRHQY